MLTSEVGLQLSILRQQMYSPVTKQLLAFSFPFPSNVPLTNVNSMLQPQLKAEKP